MNGRLPVTGLHQPNRRSRISILDERVATIGAWALIRRRPSGRDPRGQLEWGPYSGYPSIPMSTFPIALRLRRTIHEDAYIAVPVTDAVMKQNEDGTSGLNVEALMAEGLRLGQDARVEWRVEETASEIHPLQAPMPEGRSKFDGIVDIRRQ